MLVSVFRSNKKDGMYLFVENKDILNELPDAVVKQLGETEFSFEFELSEARQLSNADSKEVIDTIGKQGFYIQMPADIEDILLDIANDVGQSK